MKTVVLDNLNMYALDGSIIKAIETLKTILGTIPEEFRNSATLDGDCDEGCYSVEYRRPLTEVEILEQDTANRRVKESARHSELQQLELLKARFENSFSDDWIVYDPNIKLDSGNYDWRTDDLAMLFCLPSVPFPRVPTHYRPTRYARI